MVTWYNRQKNRIKLALSALVLTSLFAESFAFAEAGGRFDGYEIRVIRPRYMMKRNRIELAGETALIMNDSFIYTLLATGILDYHLSEMLAIEVNASYGFSIDKEDKRILQEEFQINTQILRTQYAFAGGLLWTPIYGKTQLPGGRVVYFDSFLTAQAGMTGIYYKYEQCESPPADKVGILPDKPAPRTVTYPAFNMGFGQKYFITQDTGVRWEVKDFIFPYKVADGSCTPDVDQGSKVGNSITLQIGMSKFF